MDALTLPQRITLLRQQLPASIRICRQALMESGGDLAVAHAWIVRRLVAEYRQRTGAPGDEAAADLQRCGHDVERALVLWQRRHPAPPLPPLERIAQGHPLAAELPAQDDLRRFVHVLPGAYGAFEVRLVTHAARFTETAYGFDYDLAMQDPLTRVERRFADGMGALAILLQQHGIEPAGLRDVDDFDSCLLHSPIDAYL
ncbi:hypothetical protein [uncultured Stenotrophomonas sp.]|uniref:hypothetical protein n=1 Tax=uncultured Stenotrophomonas sp. TaxID=165438 RepID=UPI0025E938B2|nr:hypothetical protein [uncultured Stenotrophomonas sp.]